MKFEHLQGALILWGIDRDLVKPDNRFKQYAKMIEEAGELAKAMLQDNEPEIQDAVGDVLVTVIILCAQLGINPVKCLEAAYEEIKDRKGVTVNGTFIKDSNN